MRYIFTFRTLAPFGINRGVDRYTQVRAHLGSREQFYLQTRANNEQNCASFLTP